ncbi:unnamed protein product [Sympodiomycopsis kandeliae]
MAGLIVAGAVLLQPKVDQYVKKLKTRRDGIETQETSSERGKTKRAFGSILRAKNLPVIRDETVAQAVNLVMMVHGLRQITPQRRYASNGQNHFRELRRDISCDTVPVEKHGEPDASIQGSDYDALPAYYRVDPGKDRVISEGPALNAISSPDSEWSVLLCKAVARLDLFCLEVLPVAERFLSPTDSADGSGKLAEASSSVFDGHLRLPESLLPPPDVCMAWAATIAGPTWSHLRISNHALSRLQSWEFPLEQISSCYAETNGDLGEGSHARGAEKRESLWTQTTGTSFDCHSDQGSGDSQDSHDILARGLRICCPSPTCSFSASVPFLAEGATRSGDVSNVASQGSEELEVDLTPERGALLSASSSQQQSRIRSSRRGLSQRGWRRKCQECGQRTDLDTLIGRKLIEDISSWCQASGRFDTCHFDGLLLSIETGQENTIEADVWASQILSPLFAPALSQERKRRSEVLKANGTLGTDILSSASSSLHPLNNSNSLGAAMRLAAVETFATTPYELGTACSWSFETISEWLIKHTLKVHPMPSLSGSLKSGMPNEHPFPDQMGGGFSAGGLDFTAHNPYEEESAKPARIQAQEKRNRIVKLLERFLAPYRKLQADGVPSVRDTVENRGDDSVANWTNVLPGIKEPVREMLSIAKELQYSGNLSGSEDNASGSSPNSSSSDMTAAIASLYSTTLRELKSSRTRSRTTLKREPLDLGTCTQLLATQATPFQVRLARLAHELSGQSVNGKSYHDEMGAYLGVVPKGLLGAVRSSDDT